MISTNRLIIGLVGAAAAGVVIGMLVAPESGNDLRKKIKDNAGNWAEKLVDLISKSKDEASDLIDDFADTEAINQ